MKDLRPLQLLLLLCSLLACQRGGPPAPRPGAPAPDVARFGAPLSAAPSTPASAVLQDPRKYDDRDVKITGQVGAVCQKKGCWMTLRSGEPGAPGVRESFKDYGSFVPAGSLGR